MSKLVSQFTTCMHHRNQQSKSKLRIIEELNELVKKSENSSIFNLTLGHRPHTSDEEQID